MELGSRGAPRRGDRLAPLRATSAARMWWPPLSARSSVATLLLGHRWSSPLTWAADCPTDHLDSDVSVASRAFSAASESAPCLLALRTMATGEHLRGLPLT